VAALTGPRFNQMQRWLLREFSKLQAKRLRAVQLAVENGRPATPVPGAAEHANLVLRYDVACYSWGVAHAKREVTELDRTAKFGVPPQPKGPQPDKAILWAQQQAGKQGKWNKDLDTEVQKVISEGLAAGKTRKQISKDLAGVFPHFSKARLENIARTETSAAYNAGKLDTFLQSNLVVAVQFTAILDDRTTTICEVRNGRILLLDSPDLVANTPPLHFQCRSTIVPVSKFHLQRLQDGDPTIVKRYFDWTDEQGPKTLEQALDWSNLEPPLRGFGGPSEINPLVAKAITPARLPKATPAAAPALDPVAVAQADMQLDLDMGKAVVFEVGKPPSWAPYADKLGFPPGPTPETKKGAGDGQLKIDHWKQAWPIDKIFEDPSKLIKTGKKQASGVILVEEKGAWLVEPTNHFGGYVNTFPKGGVASTLTHQQSALKELWEETGMQGELLAFLGEFEKGTSQTKLYLGKKTIGQPWHAGWESQKVKLVPWDQLENFLAQSKASGAQADIDAAQALKKLLADHWNPGQSIHDALKAYNDQQAQAYAVAQAAKPAPPATPAPVKPKRVKKVSLKSTKPASTPADWEEAWTKLEQSDFSAYGPRKGSNPGGVATYKDGSKWYVKEPKSSDHSRNEMLAAQLYRLAGAEVPDIRLVEMRTGKLGLASKIVDGLVNSPAALLDSATKGVGEHFAADAWLANWDVVGATHDNLLLKGDRAIRIDVGGSLLYRAQGDPKGSAWNDQVAEWMSLRTMKGSTASQVLSGTTPQQLVDSAKRVLAITPAQIKDAVERAGFDEAASKGLVDMLLARQKAIGEQAKAYEVVLARGTVTDVSDFVATVKGASPSANTHRRQEARRKEMTALIGKPATDAYADLWYAWQSSSNSTGGMVLREEWEKLQKRQPTSRPEIRAALVANQVVLRNTFATDTMTLYRGFTWSQVEEEAIAAAALGKTRARLSCWEATSWAANKNAAFSGVKVEAEVPLERVLGGMGVSPGFNLKGKYATEDEYVVGANEINGGNSFLHIELARTSSSKWGKGKRFGTIFDYVAHLRASDPATLDRILKDRGASQTLSKDKKPKETFVRDGHSWQSEGMMQAPELTAEADAMATAYQKQLAEVKAAEAKGEVGEMGVGLTPEEIWGQGPFGRRTTKKST